MPNGLAKRVVTCRDAVPVFRRNLVTLYALVKSDPASCWIIATRAPLKPE